MPASAPISSSKQHCCCCCCCCCHKLDHTGSTMKSATLKSIKCSSVPAHYKAQVLKMEPVVVPSFWELLKKDERTPAIFGSNARPKRRPKTIPGLTSLDGRMTAASENFEERRRSRHYYYDDGRRRRHRRRHRQRQLHRGHPPLVKTPCWKPDLREDLNFPPASSFY
jgi:hypothetical protein